MGGFFGTISKQDCVNDLFYGTDYNSHLGTKRAGMVTFDEKSGFHRSIHSLERAYFRSRFEDELDSFDSMLTFRYDETEAYGICCQKNKFGLAEDKNIYVGKDAADIFRSGKALCYIGKVSESIGISESLPGYWSVLPMPGKVKVSIDCKTWSVFNNSENKASAALALLYYVTGEDKQDYFYLQNRDVLPVNQLVLSQYSKYYPEFSFITDDSSQYVIESSD